MRKFYLVIIAMLAISSKSIAQQTYTWIGGSTGDYTVAANWSPLRSSPSTSDVLAFNVSSLIAVTNTPTQTIGAIQIASGNNAVTFATNGNNMLTLTGAVPLIYTTPGSILSADFFTIKLSNSTSFTLTSGTFGVSPSTGGKVIINSALVLDGGVLSFDVIGTGGTTINSLASITYISGSFNCLNASSITFAGGSNYIHASNGSFTTAIPLCVWDGTAPGASCTIVGMGGGSFAPTGLTNNFCNFTWNCASQSADVDLNIPTAMSVAGKLAISNTNAKYLRLAGLSGGVLNAGSYTQTGGNIMLQSSSGSTTLTVSGTFSQTDGIIDAVSNGSSSGTGTLEFKGAVTTSKAGMWQSNSTSTAAVWNLVFSGSASQAVTFTGGDPQSFSGNGRCNILISNADNVNGVVLSGRLHVYNNNSSDTANCSMSGIITGSSASILYTTSGVTGGTALIYSGSFFQTATAIEYPASPNSPLHLFITNSLGLTFPAGFSRTVSGCLKMAGGNLNIGSGNTLSLSNILLNNQLKYASGFITTGTLSRYFPISGLPTSAGVNSRFPFGTGANDRSINIFFTSTTIAGTAGYISVSHNTLVGITAVNFVDNGITLDKRINANWTIATGAFDLGTSGQTLSITAQANNIGNLFDLAHLRLTNGTSGFGTLIPTTGNNSAPLTGKSGLVLADINTSPLYIGSDNVNSLVIITYTWLGGVSSDWTNPNNWSGAGSNYPSSSSEIAIINSKVTYDPVINNNTSITIFKLTVASGMTLTLSGNAGIFVSDFIDFSGNAAFSPTSTFGYANVSTATQNIAPVIYGNIALSGSGPKALPSTGTVTVQGSYTILSAYPSIGSSTIVFAGTGSQIITSANYYNLIITGNRGGGIIKLGSSIASPNTTIDIANVFDVSGLSGVGDYNVGYNIVKFSSSDAQTIPGFTYQLIENGSGARVLDNLGSANPAHVIVCRSLSRGAGVYTVTGSKIKLCMPGTGNWLYTGATYYDLEIGTYKSTQNGNGYSFDFFSNATVSIAGAFTVSLTNYKLGKNNYTFNFNGTGDQTISSFKYDNATNTPSFKYPNLTVTGGARNITLASSDTIGITGVLTVPTFSAGNGFIVAGSTINLGVGSSVIPVLKPTLPGGYNYNNITVSGGTKILGGDMLIGGNVEVSGADTALATLIVGAGSGTRIVNILGNLSTKGISSVPQITGQVDLNPGTSGTTNVYVGGNVAITTRGQITATGNSNGTIIFKGASPHTYLNNSFYSNGFVNFKVGDGSSSSKLTLLSSFDLVKSTTAPHIGTLTVLPTDSIDCATFNITGNTFNGPAGNAQFNLNAGAILITANTGGIEGAATSPSTGSIINDGTIIKNYDPSASYVLNAASTTDMAFPAATSPFPMANLTVGNDVNTATFSLNKSIDISNSLTLKSNSTFALLNNNYVNLKSNAITTARVAAVPDNAFITYGTSRFVVERFYTSRRAWRLITAPITADAGRSVYTSWQKSGIATVGEGTFVTAPGANPLTNGADISPLNNYSLKLGSSLTGVLDTKNQWLSGTAGLQGTPDNLGFFLFVRGDRSTPNLFNVGYTNITTLRDTGRIQVKAQTFPAIPTMAGYTLVGNPYASPVDFKLATRNNLSNSFYVWDPYLNSSIGGYISFSDPLNSGTYLPSVTSPGGLSNILQSSQAIFVETASNGNASIVFNETSKSSVNNTSAFRVSALPMTFRANLNILLSNDSTILADGMVAQFDKRFSKAVNLEDVVKFGNVYEMLSLVRDSKTLSVERRPDIVANDTLFFKLTKTTQRNYQFQFQPTNMDASLNAFLEDSYTGVKTPVILTANNTFNFTVNGDAKSAASNRFRIVFNAKAFAVLPVTYTSIKAYGHGKNIEVDWTVENEINISKYDVEKSTDGINFIKVNTSIAKGANSSSTTYNFEDVHAAQGSNFYRILSYSETGAFEYSKVVMVSIGKAGMGMSIYPNPVMGNTIGLALNNMAAGNYNIRLINTLGQTIMARIISHAAGSSMETITPDSKLSKGVYQLELTAPDNKLTTVKVIVQ